MRGTLARGRVFITRFRMPTPCPRCPTTDKFGEIENFRSRKFRSEIWVRIYPSVCLDVCRLCTIYLKITIFDFRTIRKRTRRTRGGTGGLPRLSLLTLQPPHDQKPPKPLKITKISKNAPKCDLEFLRSAKISFDRSNGLGRYQ